MVPRALHTAYVGESACIFAFTPTFLPTHSFFAKVELQISTGKRLLLRQTLEEGSLFNEMWQSVIAKMHIEDD